MSTRIKRLQNEYKEVAQAFTNHPHIEIARFVGNPPEKYEIEYRVKGLERNGDGVVAKHQHRVGIILPRGYPTERPRCAMLTPIFHPNISHREICIGDHWVAGESLKSLIIRIGEMICYQSYNIKSPLDGGAAKWAHDNIANLPTDPVDLSISSSADHVMIHETEAMAIEPTGSVDEAGGSSQELVCPNCGRDGNDGVFQECTGQHLVCADCIVHCSVCGKVLCVMCSLETCSVCKDVVCDDGRKICQYCDHTVCDNHLFRCASCGSEGCSQCILACACVVCGREGCSKCVSLCQECHRFYCEKHFDRAHNLCGECSQSATDGTPLVPEGFRKDIVETSTISPTSVTNNATVAKRRKAGENLAKAMDILTAARNEGAGIHVGDVLKEAEETEIATKTAIIDGRVEVAYESSKKLLSIAEELHEMTLSMKREALKKSIHDLLASADEMVDTARAKGASKHCPEDLSEIDALLEKARDQLEQEDFGELAEFVHRIPSLADEIVRKTEEASREAAVLTEETEENVQDNVSDAGDEIHDAQRHEVDSMKTAKIDTDSSQLLEDLQDDTSRGAREDIPVILDQAKQAEETVKSDAEELTEMELRALLQDARNGLKRAVEHGTAGVDSTLHAECRDAMASLEDTIQTGQINEGLMIKPRLEELVSEMRQEVERLQRERDVTTRRCQELVRSAVALVEQAETLEAECFASILLKQTKSKIQEVTSLSMTGSKEVAVVAAKTAVLMAEKLLSIVQDERTAESTRSLEEIIHTLERMLEQVVRAGGERHVPKKIRQAETELEAIRFCVGSGDIEAGLNATDAMKRCLVDVQAEIEKRNREEEELREVLQARLKRAQELIGQALAEGAELFDSESLKNMQSLYADAERMEESDDLRGAFDVAQRIVERAHKLLDETIAWNTQSQKQVIPGQPSEPDSDVVGIDPEESVPSAEVAGRKIKPGEPPEISIQQTAERRQIDRERQSWEFRSHCWACGRSLTDKTAKYCTLCGVRLK